MKKSFRPTAFGSLLSSSFLEILVFCWYSRPPHVSLDREITEWDKVASWGTDKDKLAQKAVWRGSQRVAEGKALQARPKCVSKDVSHLSLADLGLTCQSTQLRSWWGCKTGDKHSRKGDKDTHFASKIFRDGVRNYAFFFSHELVLQGSDWISCVERRIQVCGICPSAPLHAIRGNLGVACTSVALKVLESLGHTFTCWNRFWCLIWLAKNGNFPDL